MDIEGVADIHCVVNRPSNTIRRLSITIYRRSGHRCSVVHRMCPRL